MEDNGFDNVHHEMRMNHFFKLPRLRKTFVCFFPMLLMSLVCILGAVFLIYFAETWQPRLMTLPRTELVNGGLDADDTRLSFH